MFFLTIHFLIKNPEFSGYIGVVKNLRVCGFRLEPNLCPAQFVHSFEAGIFYLSKAGKFILLEFNPFFPLSYLI